MNHPYKLHIEARGDRELVMTRLLQAPRALVWRAFTTPELVKRWLGPARFPMVECEMDVRVGGRYRWVWRMADGSLMGMGGTYRELVPHERIVTTEKFDMAWYPGEAVGTLTLREEGGKTTATQIVRYDSAEIRDGVLKSPMESGVAEGYDRMDDLLAALAKVEG
jgi:uncharacterized protein YndB with AHSA1/START domain